MQELFGKNLEEDIIIVAEVGVNHEGSLERAIKIVDSIYNSGIDAIKFQSYTPSRYSSKNNIERFNRISRFGLNKEEHITLSNYVKSKNIRFFSTPVSEDWVKIISKIGDAIKIASGDLTFKEVIKLAAKTNKPVILSTGTGNDKEIEQAISWFKESLETDLLEERLALLHCISAYPAKIEECNLNSIPYLEKKFGLTIGWSNHVIGSEACIAAVALGAKIIEIHVTDDKNFSSFRDHQLSFDPNELRELVIKLRKIKKSLGRYDKKASFSELENVNLFRKGIVAAKNLRKGKVIQKEDVLFARPAIEFSSNDIEYLLGKELKKDISEGYSIKKEDIIK